MDLRDERFLTLFAEVAARQGAVAVCDALIDTLTDGAYLDQDGAMDLRMQLQELAEAAERALSAYTPTEDE